MSFYREILARHEPFPFAVDEHERPMFSVNFDAVASGPVSQFEEELVKVLADAGLATLGANTFIGPQAVVPAGAGPFISVIATGGYAPEETHDGSEYERLTAQVVVRARDYRVARTRAQEVRQALHGQRNVTVAA